MAVLTLGTAGNYTWYLDYTTTQSVVNNQSTIAYTLRIHRNVSAGSGAFWGTPARSFNVTINGVSDTENFSSIDFRAAADIDFTSGSVVVTHNADGTKSPVSVSASVTGSYVSAGFPVPTTFSGKTISLATIPRAATAISRSSGTETGVATVLAISPLVSTFYYVLEYKSPATATWTGIGASGGIVGSSWPYSHTVPHAEIPSAESGTVQYRVTTLDASGGTQIGSSVESSFIYTVPSSVTPAAGVPTWAEGSTAAGLSTLTNSAAVFCQSWSKLVPTFTASPGTGASTTAAVASLTGVTGTAASGVAFANPVTTQGVSATFAVTVTDSRGRTDTETGAVSPSVHRWSLPTANAGSPVVTPTSTTQTIALSGLSATTTSFYLSGSQRNVLETRVGYRDITAAGSWVYGSWTAQSLSSSDSTDNAYAPGTALTVATLLDPTHEYEVTLQVRDVFGKNAEAYSNGLTYVESSLIVPAQNVLIAFDGNVRVGIKKIPVDGALDIAGDVYADEFYASGDQLARVSQLPAAASDTVAGLTEYATDAEAITGTATDRAMTPASAKAALNDAGSGYRLYDVVEYTASGSFAKASYPGLRAVRVRVQGGGGAGGGAAAPSGTQHSAGSGGGGGGYAERFLLAASLGTSETVTVGAGGTGVSAGTGNSGGSSSFGSLVEAAGGSGGATAAVSNLSTSAAAGAGGAGTTGDVLTTGSAGAMAGGNATLGIGGSGGASALGGGGAGGYTAAGSSSVVGGSGTNYGGGGGGAGANASAVARAGGAGAGGIVIVEVYV